MELKSLWKDQYSIRWYDCNLDGELSLPALCIFLQETAWNHANHLGFGMDAIFSKNLGWVLVQLQIRMFEYPRWQEQISLETWPSGMDKFFAFREFRMKNSQGKTVLNACSSWMIIDLDTKKIRHPELINHPGFQFIEEKADHFEPFSMKNKKNLEIAGEHTVMYSDVDYYKHVNNTKYIQWILDMVPVSQILNHRIEEFEIRFQNECHLNESIIILSNPEKYDQFLGYRQEDKKTNFEAKIKWNKK